MEGWILVSAPIEVSSNLEFRYEPAFEKIEYPKVDGVDVDIQR